MSRLLWRLSLVLCLLILTALISACSAATDDKGDAGGESSEGAPEIKLPDGQGDVRDSVCFDEIVYSRPDVEEIHGAVGRAIECIEENNTVFDEQLKLVRDIEPLYLSFRTMHTYAMIKTYENSADPTFSAELAYLEEQAPAIAQLIEDVMVAAAHSPHAVRFESDYFGDDLIEKYSSGGRYTDELVKLFEDEAELEGVYTSISTSTVTISYGGMTDTYDNIISMLKERYNESDKAYRAAVACCDVAYDKKSKEMMTDTFVSLLKVRRRIADTLGYYSYTEYAYEVLGHDYDITDTERFLDDIAKYITPVYTALYTKVFLRNTAPEDIVDSVTVLNTLSDVLAGLDEELLSVYSYMLTYGLYDISPYEGGRYEGAFTTYLDSFMSPYLFVTASGYADDYMTVSHEFGHFFDYYLNGSGEVSLDLMEVSSQGLELMVLLNLADSLTWRDYKQLYYGQMEDILLVFILQGFYARFEHIVYDLSYNEITKEKIDEAVASAARAMKLNDQVFCDFSAVMIPHIFIEPLYVQSYCTSLAAALDIFFAEMETPGEGYEKYTALLDREGYVGFEEQLERAGLGSPFDKGAVMKLADSIYFSLLGSHFFDEYKGSNTANVPYARKIELYSAA